MMNIHSSHTERIPEKLSQIPGLRTAVLLSVLTTITACDSSSITNSNNEDITEMTPAELALLLLSDDTELTSRSINPCPSTTQIYASIDYAAPIDLSKPSFTCVAEENGENAGRVFPVCGEDPDSGRAQWYPSEPHLKANEAKPLDKAFCLSPDYSEQ